MAQGNLKPRKNAGKSATPRRNKPKLSPTGLINPAIGKLRNKDKLVKIGKIEKLMVSNASANNEHLVFVQKTEKVKPLQNVFEDTIEDDLDD